MHVKQGCKTGRLIVHQQTWAMCLTFASEVALGHKDHDERRGVNVLLECIYRFEIVHLPCTASTHHLQRTGGGDVGAAYIEED